MFFNLLDESFVLGYGFDHLLYRQDLILGLLIVLLWIPNLIDLNRVFGKTDATDLGDEGFCPLSYFVNCGHFGGNFDLGNEVFQVSFDLLHFIKL